MEFISFCRAHGILIDIPPPQQETGLDMDAFLFACKIEVIASTINVNMTEIICARFSMRPASVLVVGLVIMLIVQTGANMDPSGAITNYILYGTNLSPKHYLCQFGLASFLGSALGAIAARSYLDGFDGFKGPPSTDAPPKQAETPTKKGVVYSSPNKSKSKKVD